MVKQIYLHGVDSFLEDGRLCGFIVADVNFGTNCVDIFTHGEILIISGLFFVITKYAILMINELIMGKEEIIAEFSKLKQINYFIL